MSIRGTHAARMMSAVAAVTLLFAAGACGADSTHEPGGQDDAAASGPISVVASINQWGSLAEQIGGDDVEVTSILNSTGVDAHDFEPRTADLAALSGAQVVVANGAGYDAWATKTLGQDAVCVSAAQTVGAMEGDNPHLWFSKDARRGMAKELADAFAKTLPARADAFQDRLAQWQQREDEIEQRMDEFAARHRNPTYAATESVAHYLMSDMGFEDLTPEGYASSAAAEGEPAPADLQAFQQLIEDRGVDLLVNNTQEASDSSAMITGTAGRSDVPVFDVSEQMPQDEQDLTSWIATLVDTLDTLLDTPDDCTAASDQAGSSDAQDTPCGTDADTTAGDDADTDGTGADAADTPPDPGK